MQCVVDVIATENKFWREMVKQCERSHQPGCTSVKFEYSRILS